MIMLSQNTENNLAKHMPVYANWRRVDCYQLLKYLTINIAMGLDKRLSLKNYWSSCDFFQTLWYSVMMSQTRYKVIHHTMLHCGEVDETHSKTK